MRCALVCSQLTNYVAHLAPFTFRRIFVLLTTVLAEMEFNFAIRLKETANRLVNV